MPEKQILMRQKYIDDDASLVLLFLSRFVTNGGKYHMQESRWRLILVNGVYEVSLCCFGLTLFIWQKVICPVHLDINFSLVIWQVYILVYTGCIFCRRKYCSWCYIASQKNWLWFKWNFRFSIWNQFIRFIEQKLDQFALYILIIELCNGKLC